jgi:hypothetical protein
MRFDFIPWMLEVMNQQLNQWKITKDQRQMSPNLSHKEKQNHTKLHLNNIYIYIYIYIYITYHYIYVV